jgi:hypothetical protein
MLMRFHGSQDGKTLAWVPDTPVLPSYGLVFEKLGVLTNLYQIAAIGGKLLLLNSFQASPGGRNITFTC